VSRPGRFSPALYTARMSAAPARRRFLTARWCNLILANYSVQQAERSLGVV